MRSPLCCGVLKIVLVDDDTNGLLDHQFDILQGHRYIIGSGVGCEFALPFEYIGKTLFKIPCLWY